VVTSASVVGRPGRSHRPSARRSVAAALGAARLQAQGAARALGKRELRGRLGFREATTTLQGACARGKAGQGCEVGKGGRVDFYLGSTCILREARQRADIERPGFVVPANSCSTC